MKFNLLAVAVLVLGVSSSGAWAIEPSGGISAANKFNSDAFLDLAIVSPGYNSVRILLGTGGGQFNSSAAVSYATGVAPSSVATADFNADGKIDLVVTNGGASTVSVLLGNGNGTFNTQTTYAVGSSPKAVSIADFDGDAKLDLAVVNGGTTVSVLLGNGDGTFNTQTTYTVGNGHVPGGITIADLDSDGVDDLGVVNTADSTVSVLTGVGDGTFNTQTTYDVGDGQSTTGGITSGDLDGNTYMDIAVLNSNSNCISVLYGSGTGFADQVSFGVMDNDSGGHIAISDFNLDGNLDLAALNPGVNTLSVLMGRGDKTFQSQIEYKTGVKPAAYSFAVGDFNGDGFMDVGVVGNAYSVGILLGRGDGTFHLVSSN